MAVTSLRCEPGLRATLLGGLCAAVLVLGACSDRNKTPAPEISVDAPSLDLSGADAEDLAQYFVISPRRGDEPTTLAALDALGLGAAAGTREIDGSTVTWTGWAQGGESGAVEAERVVLRGVYLEDGVAGFDAVEIDGLTAEDFADAEAVSVDAYDDEDADLDVEAPEAGTPEEDAPVVASTVRLATLVVIEPEPAIAQSLADFLMSRSAQDSRDELAGMSQGLEFTAMRLEALSIDVRERDERGTVTLEQLVLGAASDTADIVVERLDFDWAGAAGSFELSMDGMTALDIAMDLDAEDTANPFSPTPGLLGSVLSNFGPGSDTLPYREVDIGAVSIRSDMLDAEFEGFEADSEQKGDVMTLRTVLAPMQIDIKDASGTPLAPFMDSLRENGLAELTLQGSYTTEMDRRADRVSFSDAKLDIDGGLRLDCDYALEGIIAAARYMEESGVTQPSLDGVQSDEDFQRYMEQAQAYSEAQREANGRIAIAGMDCTVQDVADNSLVTRGYAVASAVTGRPVAVLKGGAKTMIALSSMTAQTEFQRDLMNSVGSGLIDFIDNPGQTMRVRMAPAKPVALSTLQGENATLDGLNLEVEVQ